MSYDCRLITCRASIGLIESASVPGGGQRAREGCQCHASGARCVTAGGLVSLRRLAVTLAIIICPPRWNANVGAALHAKLRSI